MITEEMVKAVLHERMQRLNRIWGAIFAAKENSNAVKQCTSQTDRPMKPILVNKQMLADLVAILLHTIPDFYPGPTVSDRFYLAPRGEDTFSVGIHDMSLIERDKALLLARAVCKRKGMPINIHVDCLRTLVRHIWHLYNPDDRDIPPLERLDKILAVYEPPKWQFWRKPLPK